MSETFECLGGGDMKTGHRFTMIWRGVPCDVYVVSYDEASREMFVRLFVAGRFFLHRYIEYSDEEDPSVLE